MKIRELLLYEQPIGNTSGLMGPGTAGTAMTMPSNIGTTAGNRGGMMPNTPQVGSTITPGDSLLHASGTGRTGAPSQMNPINPTPTTPTTPSQMNPINPAQSQVHGGNYGPGEATTPSTPPTAPVLGR